MNAATTPTSRPTLFRALLHRWTWIMALRDGRSQRGRLALYALSIAAGICALTAIHTLKASVQTGIATQTKSLLGADLLISSRRPIPEESLTKLAPWLRAMGKETAFSSMLSLPSGERSRLVQVRAIEGGYPFYATVETEPPEAWQRLQTERGIIVETSLLEEFGLKVGQSFKLGAIELPILGSLRNGMPRSNRFSGFAPEAFLRHADLEATGLAGAQSLVFHHRALELWPESAAQRRATIAAIKRLFPEDGVQFQTPEEREEAIGESLNRMQEFLGIMALVALVLGGIGVAGAIHTHVQRRIPTVAILLCLGCPTQWAFGIYLAQAMSIGLLGTCVGALSGGFLHGIVVHFFGSGLPFVVAIWPQPLVVLETASAGFVLCCGFALLPLLRIRDVSPGATLGERQVARRSGVSLERGVYLLLAGLVWSVARLNGTTSLRALWLTGALALAFAALTLAGHGLMWCTRLLVRPTWPYLLRQGISNLFRPHNQTLLFLLSLGLGVFLLLTTWFTRSLVLTQLRIDDRDSQANLYLVDVQPDQVATVSGLLGEQGLPVLQSAPMVSMRIESVRGQRLAALTAAHAPENPTSKPTHPPSVRKVPRWVIEREYRSTYRATVNSDETIVAGEWPPAPMSAESPAPISLEQKLASDLGVGIGDEMVMDVQGVPMRVQVVCLRKVDWSKFNLNFFMVFAPGVLENAPQFHLFSTRVPSARIAGQLQRALLQRAPNVSSVDLTSILATVRRILEKAAQVIQWLAGFSILAALPILAGALLNGKEQRVKESLLLRTLGASEIQVRTIVLVEYASLGSLSAVSGILLALVAQWAEARWIFKIPLQHEPLPILLALSAACGGSIAAGLWLTSGVCNRPPLEALRQES